MNKWDRRYLSLALFVSTWSKDPSTQTGAVIIRPDNSIASIGFNGFPRGENDDPELYLDRDYKYKNIIHAEINAIGNANEDVDGYTLYQWPGYSCSDCATVIRDHGLARVVNFEPTKDFIDRWGEEFDRASVIFKVSRIQVDLIERTLLFNMLESVTLSMQQLTKTAIKYM